jgi:tetratricopeptide (TPR) repeat protein
MVYLSLTIIGAIILVAYAIRRLPFLRTNRLGLEINAPRPSIGSFSNSSLWHRILSLWRSPGGSKRTLPRVGEMVSPLLKRAKPSITEQTEFRPLAASPVMPGVPFASSNDPMAMAGIKGDDDPFWQEEFGQTPAPLELPTKGLITRRGESQKIAHELMSKADEAFRKKDYKTAETCYLKAAVKDPDNARIYNRLGVIYLQMKNYRDAIEAFRGALKFDDRVASRHYNIALAYLGKRDFRSAEKGLKEAIRLDPANEKYRKTLQAIQRQPA